MVSPRTEVVNRTVDMPSREPVQQLDTLPDDSLATSLRNRALDMLARGDHDEIGEAIESLREVVARRVAPHLQRAESLDDLANALETRFEQQGKPDDIEGVIAMRREALALRPAPHLDRGVSLSKLGAALRTRFIKCGGPRNIDEAIAVHREALALRNAPHSERFESLRLLGDALRSRGEQDNIDEAIALHTEAVALCPVSHPSRALCVSAHGLVILERAEETEDPDDIKQAITLLREALALRPALHADRATTLSNLARAIRLRFERRGDLEDINEAIALHRDALSFRSAPHQNRGVSLTNLAVALETRFRMLGDPTDLDEAMEMYREAVSIHAGRYPSRSVALSNLGGTLLTRFSVRGDPDDINESIAVHREALKLLSPSHPYYRGSLSDLATALWTRIEVQDDPGDMDEAIVLYRRGLALCPAPHPDRSMLLNNLASALHTRSEERGDPRDLNEAIVFHREALELRLDGDHYRGQSLNNLANALWTRFEDQGNADDIDETVRLHGEALSLLPAGRPGRDVSLTNLANAISLQVAERQRGDIDEAISLHREARVLRASPHPRYSDSLNDLATALVARFEKRRNQSDVDEAVNLFKQSLALCTPPNPKRDISLHGLSRALLARVDAGLLGSVDEAFVLRRQAATYESSTPLRKFSSAVVWAQLAQEHNHRTCLEAYQLAVDLLPQIAALNLDLKSRQQRLTRGAITSLAVNSATAALALNQRDLAVEFFEASRSVFWSQALQLRPSLDHLVGGYPELLNKLRGISCQLEESAIRDNGREIDSGRESQRERISFEAEGVRCRELDEERTKTLDAVRKLPGFEYFLKPRKLDALRQAAVSGPVVVLLATNSSSSALIIQPEDVRHIELPSWTPRKFELCAELPRVLSGGNDNSIAAHFEVRSSPQTSADVMELGARLYGARKGRVKVDPDAILCRLLAELWYSIVKPVVEALDLNKSEHPPRLWWCPTGLFTFLPIHAAGVYKEKSTDCLSDYAISSYTPTLTALLDPPTVMHTTSSFKVTVAIEPNAPDSSSLLGTVYELDHIAKHVPMQWLNRLRSPKRSKVMEHLLNSSIMHFACHGVQDARDPLDSGLMLADGRLKISEIMRRQGGDGNERMRKGMSLAFLSACETARGDETIPDEAMHLAASLLFAGFRGIVGTMWTMNDLDGPKVADAFYEHLFTHTSPGSVVPDLTKAAEALHVAVLKLRGKSGVGFLRWVPFVHYGL
ncbi:CHAT domain-containing protein [Mycena epipterygia]|nr:CHAT domain-containing protein [Mycena epipterygia]